jgi:succinoglycan biosynthesis transport protein ExoP
VDAKAVGALLREHRHHFELIVIDSPAILPLDGGMFAECADRIVLIVEWERSERSAVMEAIAFLGTLKQKIAGVVLNKVSPQWYRLFDGGRYIRDYAAATVKEPIATKTAA